MREREKRRVCDVREGRVENCSLRRLSWRGGGEKVHFVPNWKQKREEEVQKKQSGYCHLVGKIQYPSS